MLSKSSLERLNKKAEQGKRRLDVICEVAEKDDGKPRSSHDPDHYKYHVPSEKII